MNLTKLSLLRFFFCFASFILISCTSQKNINQKAVLKVNEDVVTVKEFSHALSRKLQSSENVFIKDTSSLNQVKKSIIKDFVLKLIITQWAKKHSIQINEKKVEEKINSIRSQYPNDAEFRNVLVSKNIRFVDWKKNLRFSLLEEQVIKNLPLTTTPPTKEEMEAFYKRQKSSFMRKERIFLRQIVLKKRSSAEKIYKILKSSPKKFRKLAANYSIAPEARAQGAIGWIPKGSLEIFDKAFDLPLNQISSIYKSDYGFHIFRVEKKQESRYIPFAKAQNMIAQKILIQNRQARFDAWLKKEIGRSKIYKDNALIDQITVDFKPLN